MAIDLLRWVAEKHRAWGLGTLPPKIAAAYLGGLFAGRTTPHVVVPSGTTVLRIT